VDTAGGSHLSKVTDRVGNLVELLTTLDKRILATLDSLEEMRSAVSALDSLSTGGEDLVADIRRRIARFDERINADMDEIKSELLARLGEMEGLAGRLDTLERSLASIEKATVHLDQTMTGMVESLPEFMSRRIKPEGGGNPPGAT
jgi:predicted  nucleic acid-binding Zn-ribbon protein